MTCFLIPLIFINASYYDEFPLTSLYGVVNVGCEPLLGFLYSETHWWYDVTYIEFIQETYSLVINSTSPRNIKPLNSSIFSRFGSINAYDLVRELFLEESSSNNTHFDQFYNKCAPNSCSYIRVQRRDVITSFLLLIAICSGLHRILRRLISLSGKVVFYCIDWWNEHHAHRQMISFCDYLKQILKNIHKSIKTLNLFRSELNDEISIHQQKIYTRIYLLLYITSLGILLFLTAITQHSIRKTYPVSSIVDYEQLLINFKRENIDCPCSLISIPYGEIITELQVNRFHEACSRDIIRSIFFAGTEPIEGQTPANTNNFWIFRRFFIDSLNLLCALAQHSVENSIDVFLTSMMLSNQLQSSTEFYHDINNTIIQFQKKILINFGQTLDLIRMSVHGNALLALFSLNWNIIYDENISAFVNVPVIHHEIKENTSCSCATLQTCTMPVQIHISDELVNVEGLVLGCHLLETVLLSSLSCFYSPICIQNIRNEFWAAFIIDADTRLHDSLTRFNVNDTIETLAYEMFIESWTNNVSYEKYYRNCLPNHCIYTYYYQFDAMELLTTFLSVFAGLSAGIRVVVPYLLRLFQSIRNYFHNTRQ
ncbi:unnamed protein product [Adineta ricciae]|uniref:Uncharacterized protein n=1 Tax=Adineta ricciae TaxID=249248 RepID=A0A815V0R6_ADIRI|nr:unnamed protein product [Adineta ricciae]CAF1523616.1 unnamed protein product [Adineta ricciae]